MCAPIGHFRAFGFLCCSLRISKSFSLYPGALRANDDWRAARLDSALKTQKRILFCDFARCAQIAIARSTSECRGALFMRSRA